MIANFTVFDYKYYTAERSYFTQSILGKMIYIWLKSKHHENTLTIFTQEHAGGLANMLKQGYYAVVKNGKETI